MLEALIPKVKEVLDAITGEGKPLAEVHAWPQTDIRSYPAVLFFPTEGAGEMLDTKTDLETYRFRVYCVVEASSASLESAWTERMPAVHDAVRAALRDAWDRGVVDGHRAWATVENGSWYPVVSEKGTIVVAELLLSIKLGVNVN